MFLQPLHYRNASRRVVVVEDFWIEVIVCFLDGGYEDLKEQGNESEACYGEWDSARFFPQLAA